MSDFRVTQEMVDAILDASEVQEHVFYDKDLIVCYKLPNNFTVVGRGVCVDPENFSLEIGRQVARQDAAKTIWLLEGYKMQQQLNDSKE